MKKNRLDNSVWLLLVMLFSAVLAGGVLFFQLKPDLIAGNIANGEQIKLLILVRDDYDLVHSEIFCYDPGTGQSAMFNIPADTGVWNPSSSRYSPLSLLFRPENGDRYHAAVNQLSDSVIPYRVVLSRDQLASLIDLIGGVEVFLVDPVTTRFEGEVRMLPAGGFNMQGYQALFYLQHRLPGETEGEFIKRKQGMIRLVFQKAGEAVEELSSGAGRRVLFSLIETDFDRSSVKTLLEQFADIDPELMQMHQMRGRRREVNGLELFLPQKEGALFREQVRQITRALGDESFIKRELLSLNLEILNGTGRNMLAARTTDHYQSYGYNVIVTANAESDAHERTVVYARNAEFMRAAGRIAGIIDCSQVVMRAVDPALEDESWNGADVTIILGSDYDNFTCKN